MRSSPCWMHRERTLGSESGAWRMADQETEGSDRQALLERVLSGRIIAIVRLNKADSLVEVAAALVRGGIRSLEFTLTTPGALNAIERCREAFGEHVVVGAGTVITTEDVNR